jgi:integrase
LSPRADGRWCKKLKVLDREDGDDRWVWKMFYFTGTADEALTEYLRVKDSLIAGYEPPPKGGYLTVAELVNNFLHHKKQKLVSRELAQISWNQYEAVGKMLVEFFGRQTPAEQLRSADFQRLRADIAAKCGHVTLGNRINVIRMIFKYGYKTELLSRPAQFSVEFDKPSAKAYRLAKASKGQQVFEPQQIHTLLMAAEPHMQAMILLAINGGLGNTDLAMLTADRFDLDGGWLDYPRPKTGIARRVPLWPETIAAVRKAIAQKRQPKNPEDARLLFIGALGTSYVSHTGGHRVAHEFSNLCARVGVTGRVFYDLRRTFETVADNLSRDADGVKAIMGHAPKSGDMSAVYRQSWFEDRLRSIVEHVRGWLFAKTAKRDCASGSRKTKAPRRRRPTKGRTMPPDSVADFAFRIVG